jgi:hypothetical protein
MIKFEQIGTANGVERHRPMFDRPPLNIHSIAVAPDLEATITRGTIKPLRDLLGSGILIKPGSKGPSADDSDRPD